MDCWDSILVRSVERLLQMFALLLRPYLDMATTSGRDKENRGLKWVQGSMTSLNGFCH